MKQIINLILLLAISVQLASCQNKEKDMGEKFYWQEGTNAPLGYPAEVYRGGLELPEGGYVSLFHGTIPGDNGWGNPGGGMSSGIKSIPNRLNVKYLSYAENQFYYANCDIDYDKMVKLFKEPLKRRGVSGNLIAEHFNKITVGFAPGGMVIVWISGSEKTVEIGRYQAEKIVIPQSEINELDPAEHLIFEEAEVKRVMQLESIIPKEVQEANKNKPIPFGLWDTYRIKYNWTPVFQIQNEGTMGDFSFFYFNGEDDNYFYENNIQAKNNTELFYQVPHQGLPIPKTIAFDWFDKNQKNYSGFFRFNEQEIFNAFKEICGEDKETKIEMLVRVNIPNTYATILLRGSNGKEVPLMNHIEDNFFEVKR